MKQKLDTREYFDSLEEDSKFELLYEAQLKLQTLEDIVEDLQTWGEWSSPYKQA